jgi:hypothetical protein
VAERPTVLTGDHLAAHSDDVLTGFRCSLRAIRAYLGSGQVEPGIWA